MLPNLPFAERQTFRPSLLLTVADYLLIFTLLICQDYFWKTVLFFSARSPSASCFPVNWIIACSWALCKCWLSCSWFFLGSLNCFEFFFLSPGLPLKTGFPEFHLWFHEIRDVFQKLWHLPKPTLSGGGGCPGSQQPGVIFPMEVPVHRISHGHTFQAFVLKYRGWSSNSLDELHKGIVTYRGSSLVLRQVALKHCHIFQGGTIPLKWRLLSESANLGPRPPEVASASDRKRQNCCWAEDEQHRVLWLHSTKSTTKFHQTHWNIPSLAFFNLSVPLG